MPCPVLLVPELSDEELGTDKLEADDDADDDADDVDDVDDVEVTMRDRAPGSRGRPVGRMRLLPDGAPIPEGRCCCPLAPDELAEGAVPWPLASEVVAVLVLDLGAGMDLVDDASDALPLGILELAEGTLDFLAIMLLFVAAAGATDVAARALVLVGAGAAWVRPSVVDPDPDVG